ncbi:hypothetical protein SAMN05518848_104384 [Paenibacillus sp. PDC88]|nr:hypothetical protein SAMN05518848_104384 [Paenibacillus sp. PDC88]
MEFIAMIAVIMVLGGIGITAMFRRLAKDDH